MSAAQIVLAQVLLAALLGGAVFYTVFGWPRRYGALSGRSRLFRTVGLLLLDLLLALALMWFYLFTPANQGDTPGRVWLAREALYVLSCVLLVLFLLCVSALDALETLSTLRREERAVVRQALDAEIARVRAREGAAAAAASSPGEGGGSAG